MLISPLFLPSLFVMLSEAEAPLPSPPSFAVGIAQWQVMSAANGGRGPSTTLGSRLASLRMTR
jgi:hypothetical protein